MKHFEFTTLDALLSVIRDELPSMEQYIDESKVIETVLWCNDKLGISIRKQKETTLRVRNYEAELPLDFQKVVYVAALEHHSFGIAQFTDPFDNFVDQTKDICTVEYLQGCETKEKRCIRKKCGDTLIQNYTNWTELSLSPQSYIYTTSNCINKKIRGKHIINIEDGLIQLPFREGELYLMYFASLIDEETGSIQIPFSNLIFPWYKWACIEKILILNALNSEQDVSQKLKLAQQQKSLSWLDAFNFHNSKNNTGGYTIPKETRVGFI